MFIRCWGILSLTRQENVATIGRARALFFELGFIVPRFTVKYQEVTTSQRMRQGIWKKIHKVRAVAACSFWRSHSAVQVRLLTSCRLWWHQNVAVFQIDDSQKQSDAHLLVPPPAYLNLSPPQAMAIMDSPFENKWLDNDLRPSLLRILKANKSLVYPMARVCFLSIEKQ